MPDSTEPDAAPWAWVRHDPSATITIWSPRNDEPLVVRLERCDEPPPAVDGAAVARAWADRVEQNERLFNGPISAVAAFDPGTQTIRWRRDEYRRLAVRSVVATGTIQLSVMALLFAPDDRGRRCVMLGQRASDVAVYPGLWEFGPSGGIDPPDACELDLAAVASQLAREIHEEIGLAIEPEHITPTLIVRDAVAGSLDIACRVEIERIIAPDTDSASTWASAWEYDAVAWVPMAELGSWIEHHGDAVCAPTIGVSRVLTTGARYKVWSD